MKKMILGTLFIAATLFGDDVTLTPYGGVIDYDSNDDKSIKDSSKLFGLYTSLGNLNYLLELNYQHINTTYKNETIEELNQDDITLIYGKYFQNFMFKLGYHHINTNDTQLNDGNIMIASIGGYNKIGNKKFSYGLEGYYSLYKDGHNEEYVAKSIEILQLTPYFNLHRTFSNNTKIAVALKVNYQMASDYLTKDYLSYEVSPTLYYKDIFITLSRYGGEMRTGVKDGGMTVYNTLDLQKGGRSIKIGYSFNKDAVVSVSYSANDYQEYDLLSADVLKEGTNSVAVATLKYSF